jgi:hypothetical protein
MTRLASRAIKESTHKEYLGTIRNLGLEATPFEEVTVAMLTGRLNRVLNPLTRRKHSINLRAALGVPVPCARPVQKVYQLPDLETLHQALAHSAYAMYGFSMLYAGLRIGESLVKQRQEGCVLYVDRQRTPDGHVTTSKTQGPVFLPEWFAEAYETFEPCRCSNTVYVGIRRAGTKAGLALNPHQLRHAFATNLVRAGASPDILRRQMRHHDVTVSLRYYVQTTDADIESVMAQF